MIRKIHLGWLRMARDERRGSDATAVPRPSSPLDFDDGPIQSYTDTEHDTVRRLSLRPRDTADMRERNNIEALCLETLISPSLRPIQQMVMSREEAINPMDSGRRPSADMLAASPGSYGFVQHAVDTPTEERPDPFETFTVTPIPKRPGGARTRPVSARSRRDLPLRVTAVRRMHQQAMAEAYNNFIEEELQELDRLDETEDMAPLPDLHLPQGEGTLFDRRRSGRVFDEQIDRLPQVQLTDPPEGRPLTPEDLDRAFAAFGFDFDSNRSTPQECAWGPRDEDPFEFDR